MWLLSSGLQQGMLGPVAPKGSLADILADGIIEIYSGARPTSPDLTEVGSGVLLLTLTLSSGAFVPGVPTNGINLGVFTGNVIGQKAGEVWSGEGLATATAGWCRWYANDVTKGASTAAVRMDGIVSITGAELNMANGTLVNIGVTTEITGVVFSLAGV